MPQTGSSSTRRTNVDEDDGSKYSIDEGSDSAEQIGDGQSESDDVSIGEAGQDAQQHISNVSFAALKKADTILSRKRKREHDTSAEQDAKLAVLRERLQKLKQKSKTESKSGEQRSDRRVKAAQGQTPGSDDASEESADSEDPDEGTGKRSKHAPATQSSKRQVTRRRQVIEVPKHITRDPRFDALRQQPQVPTNDKAYEFLRDYQAAEMQQLRTAIKAAKTDDEKQILRRKLNSMENQAKARTAKERERDVVRKHRQAEGEQVRQGKTPYFLKKSEVKQRALVEKFQNMKGKDREKLMERRRRKESQKEKKRMPTYRAPMRHE